MSSLEAGGHCNLMANGPCFAVRQPGIRGVLFSETVVICKMGMIITHLALPTVVPCLRIQLSRDRKNSRGKENYMNFKEQDLNLLCTHNYLLHGQKSLVGYSPWGHKESDMTEQLNTHTHTHTRTTPSCLYVVFMKIATSVHICYLLLSNCFLTKEFSKFSGFKR